MRAWSYLKGEWELRTSSSWLDYFVIVIIFSFADTILLWAIWTRKLGVICHDKKETYKHLLMKMVAENCVAIILVKFLLENLRKDQQ